MRPRLVSVVVIALCGAVGVMSSTQTWLHVRLTGSAAHDLTVSGAAAIPVLAPLSLAALALGVAISIVGRVLRYAFGVLALLIGAAQLYLSAHLAFALPVSAVARTVTDATGITGARPVAELVDRIQPTPWPYLTVAVWIVLCAGAVYVLATAARWGDSGRKYRSQPSGPHPGEGPLDAVDSWDELSRGEDPTGGGRPR